MGLSISMLTTSSVWLVVGATAGSCFVRPDSFDHLVWSWLGSGLRGDVDQSMKRDRNNHDAARKAAKIPLKLRLIPRCRVEQMMSIDLLHDISSPTRFRWSCHTPHRKAFQGSKCKTRKRLQIPEGSRSQNPYQCGRGPQEDHGGVCHAWPLFWSNFQRAYV